MLATDFKITKTLTYFKMKARYRGTIAGIIWVTLNPISLFIVHALIFKHVLQIDLPNYSRFLLGGVLPWVFVTTSITMTTGILVQSRESINSFAINPFVFILSTVFDNFFNFCLSTFILLTYYLIFGSSVESYTGLFMAIPTGLIILIAVSLMSSLLALVHVFYRDTLHVVQFINNFMYFLTPIFYPVSAIPADYRFLVNFNPFYLIIQPFQVCIWNFNWGEFSVSLAKLGILIILLSISLKTFWKRKHSEFYLYV